MSTLKVNKLQKTVSGAATFTLPTADGSADQHLKTDGSGQLGWVTPPTPLTQETGTWTSNVRIMTTLTNTSYDTTKTLTGKFFRIGRHYMCYLPALDRTNLGLGANFLVDSFSVPTTSSSTNYALRIASNYNFKGRWSSAEYTTGQIMCILGANSDYAEVRYQAIDGSGGTLFPYAVTAGSQLHCMIDFWVD